MKAYKNSMPSQDKDLRPEPQTNLPSREIPVRFIGPGHTSSTDQIGSDNVALEGPLEIRLHGKPAAVLLRTPGHDVDLATGFLFHEGIISSSDQILSIDLPEGTPENAPESLENVLLIRLDSASRGKSLNRFFYSTSSCGACGKNSLESLEVRGQEPKGNFTICPKTLSGLVETMRTRQKLFQSTGGVHGCGLFDLQGNLLALREDVGRHNALDKLTGFGLTRGWVPFSDRILILSGRIGYEMVQKAVVAGIPLIVAVGAPTSLAVEIAERFGITLVGFLRGESMNVYSHPGRID